MRRTVGFLLAALLLVTACGDDGPSPQAATEEAAVEATVDAMRGTLRGDADAVIDFLTEECRANVDRQEIEFAMLFVRGLMESDDGPDLDDVEISGVAEDFDGESATIEITYEALDGAELDSFMFGDTEVDVVYENERWVGADCDFDDDGSSGDDADLQAELADLGLGGSQDDPIPLGTAAPIGGGFEIVFTTWDPDAVERYDVANDTTLVLDDGDVFAVLEYQVRYTDDEEPRSLGQVSIDLVGSDAIGVDQGNCGAIAPDLSFTSRSIFTGGVFTGAACFSATPAELDGALASVTGDFFLEQGVFFDPDAAATTIETLTGTTGPSPDGDLTDDRLDPLAPGAPIELDDEWTVQVDGFTADATEQLLAESSFAVDPRPDRQFAVLDVTLTYRGDTSARPFDLTIGLVGDANLAADDCDFVSVPNELDRGAELFTGATVSGSLCFEVAASDVGSLLAWFQNVSSFDSDDLAFVALG